MKTANTNGRKIMKQLTLLVLIFISSTSTAGEAQQILDCFLENLGDDTYTETPMYKACWAYSFLQSKCYDSTDSNSVQRDRCFESALSVYQNKIFEIQFDTANGRK